MFYNKPFCVHKPILLRDTIKKHFGGSAGKYLTYFPIKLALVSIFFCEYAVYRAFISNNNTIVFYLNRYYYADSILLNMNIVQFTYKYGIKKKILVKSIHVKQCRKNCSECANTIYG